MFSTGLKGSDLPHVDGQVPLPADLRGAVLLLGNFDGMHRGHRALLEAGRDMAGATALAIMCATPHPRIFFDPETPPMRISCGAARERIFSDAGFDYVFAPRFDATFAAQEPEAFIRDMLIDRLGVSAVICGEDFRFGRRRAGDVALLDRMGKTHGFGLHAVAEVKDGGHRISSSFIRAHLARGDIAGATHLLGAPWLTPVRPCGLECFAFDAEQMLPPAGTYSGTALDREGQLLAKTEFTLGHARQVRSALPRNTAYLAWLSRS